MKNVAVFFGGRSAEHDVSILTGLSAVIDPLEMLAGYKPIPVYITRDGSWYSNDELKNIHFYTTGGVEDKLRKMKKVGVKFDDGLWLTKAGFRRENVHVDIAFSAMHGTYGEDGSLMGLLRMANVPFVGCDMAASVVAMDKVYTKQVAGQSGLPVTKYIWFYKSEWEREKSKIMNDISKLRYPVFVKPVHLGSSIALSKAKDKTELENALELAMHYDNKILVEEAVENLVELTLPIMGNHEPQPALLERPLVKEGEVFDFNTKYMSGGGKKLKGGLKAKGAKGSQGYSEVPAKIDKSLYKNAENVALGAYRAIGCEGIARVDLLVDSKTNTVYVNEINTLPGSLYLHNWRAAGVSAVELVEKLINLALERHRESQRQTTVFETSFLQQF